jgi:hypothetical protein
MLPPQDGLASNVGRQIIVPPRSDWQERLDLKSLRAFSCEDGNRAARL